jgi:hypothetical protein
VKTIGYALTVAAVLMVGCGPKTPEQPVNNSHWLEPVGQPDCCHRDLFACDKNGTRIVGDVIHSVNGVWNASVDPGDGGYGAESLMQSEHDTEIHAMQAVEDFVRQHDLCGARPNSLRNKQ